MESKSAILVALIVSAAVVVVAVFLFLRKSMSPKVNHFDDNVNKDLGGRFIRIGINVQNKGVVQMSGDILKSTVLFFLVSFQVFVSFFSGLSKYLLLAFSNMTALLGLQEIYYQNSSPGDKVRKIITGLFAIIATILGFVASFSLIYTITSSMLISLVSGVFWAIFIFAFESFISTSRALSSVATAKGSSAKTRAIVLRVSLSLILGIIISDPILIIMFDAQITERIMKSRVSDSSATGIGRSLKKIEEEISKKELEIDLLKNEDSGAAILSIPGRISTPLEEAKASLNDVKKQLSTIEKSTEDLLMLSKKYADAAYGELHGVQYKDPEREDSIIKSARGAGEKFSFWKQKESEVIDKIKENTLIAVELKKEGRNYLQSG